MDTLYVNESLWSFLMCWIKILVDEYGWSHSTHLKWAVIMKIFLNLRSIDTFVNVLSNSSSPHHICVSNNLISHPRVFNCCFPIRHIFIHHILKNLSILIVILKSVSEAAFLSMLKFWAIHLETRKLWFCKCSTNISENLDYYESFGLFRLDLLNLSI